MGFAKLPRSSAAADAVHAIQEMILSGRLTPGQRLPAERELSELLGISRPTLRETIRSLVSLNILESRHGAGTFVASLDASALLAPLQFVMALHGRTVDELFEARLVLEPALAALAATRVTDEQVTALRALTEGVPAPQGAVDSAHDVYNAHDPQDSVELDVRLHRLVAQAAGNVLLSTMLESLSALGRTSREVTAAEPGVLRQTARDHAAIVDAIAGRDPAAARAAMAAHLTRIAGVAHQRLA